MSESEKRVTHSGPDGRQAKYNDFITRHRDETLIFALAFTIAFSSLHIPAAGTPLGGLEQWINIIHDTIYGSQDMLFSYGPLYWILGQSVTPYAEYGYWITLLTMSTLSAFLCSIFFTLSYKAGAIILFALTYFLFSDSFSNSNSYMLWPFALVAYLEFSRSTPLRLQWGAWLAIGIFVGVCFYVRFFFGLIGAGFLGLYLLSNIRNSRDARVLICFIAGICLSYLAVGMLIFHEAAALAEYVTINNQLSFGNSVDMTYDVTNTRESFMMIAITILGLNAFLLLKRRVLLLPINFLLLICFKLGFSRTDHYIGYFVAPMAVLSLLPLFDGSKAGRAAFLTVTVALFCLAAEPNFPGARTINKLTPSIDFNLPYAERLKRAYSALKLDATMIQRVNQATIDVYPYNNEYLLANGMNYQHRPLFQNYMTLTPTLDAMNQRYFESAERPAFVLWTAGITCNEPQCHVFDGFDNKYSLNEDPLTSSTILLNYHAVQQGQGRNGIPLVLLKANDQVTHYSLSASPALPMEFGKWYTVPPHLGNVLKLLPTFEFTMLGKIKNLLFRGSVVEISYRMKSAEVRTYRLNLLNAVSGVWISPLLDSFDWTGDEVSAILLTSKTPGYIKPIFKARWATLAAGSVSKKQLEYNQIVFPTVERGNDNAIDCSASIDVANGESPLPSTINTQGSLYLRGWLARSTAEGTLFEQTLLTLTDSTGHKTFISTSAENRPDVAIAFKSPKLAGTGFKSIVDLSPYHGNYILGLAGLSDSRLFSCNQFAVPVIVP